MTILYNILIIVGHSLNYRSSLYNRYQIKAKFYHNYHSRSVPKENVQNVDRIAESPKDIKIFTHVDPMIQLSSLEREISSKMQALLRTSYSKRKSKKC